MDEHEIVNEMVYSVNFEEEMENMTQGMIPGSGDYEIEQQDLMANSEEEDLAQSEDEINFQLEFYGTDIDCMICSVEGFMPEWIWKKFEGEWYIPNNDEECYLLRIPHRYFIIFLKQMEQLNVSVPERMVEEFIEQFENKKLIFTRADRDSIKFTLLFFDSEKKFDVFFLNINDRKINRHIRRNNNFILYFNYSSNAKGVYIVTPSEYSMSFIRWMKSVGIDFVKSSKFRDIHDPDALDDFWREWWTSITPEVNKSFYNLMKKERDLKITYLECRQAYFYCRFGRTLKDELRKKFKGRWFKSVNDGKYSLRFPIKMFPVFVDVMESNYTDIPQEMLDAYKTLGYSSREFKLDDPNLKSIQDLTNDLVNNVFVDHQDTEHIDDTNN